MLLCHDLNRFIETSSFRVQCVIPGTNTRMPWAKFMTSSTLWKCRTQFAKVIILLHMKLQIFSKMELLILTWKYDTLFAPTYQICQSSQLMYAPALTGIMFALKLSTMTTVLKLSFFSVLSSFGTSRLFTDDMLGSTSAFVLTSQTTTWLIWRPFTILWKSWMNISTMCVNLI